MQWYQVLLIVIVAIFAVGFIGLQIMYRRGYKVLEEKGYQSQVCYEQLREATQLDLDTNVEFNVNKRRLSQLLGACFKNNSWHYNKYVLCLLRIKAVVQMGFKKEKVLQTAPIAAALSFIASEGQAIENVRNGKKENKTIKTDVAFSGMQAFRTFMVSNEGNDEFKKKRTNSAMNVFNAFNSLFYKYPTNDGRHFSSHAFYEHQKVKLMKALNIAKDPKDFAFKNLKSDRKMVTQIFGNAKALELEELAFNCGASGSMLRTREEFKKTEVGEAICSMPLFRLTKVGDAPVKKLGKTNDKGPLSGLKVLDLTHIIAGPTSTRMLAEYGADVLLVRRGTLMEQEQKMAELDCWAGKHLIHLDFNVAEQLERCKALVKEADVIISSFKVGTLDKFGLSKDDILALNPNVIYGQLNCFSDTVWKDRPGWAPLAEDITGLSIRNGSMEKPKNLNGVPLDYIPGFIFTIGIFEAIRQSVTVGGSYVVHGSLSRAALWLHDCTDACEGPIVSGLSSNLTFGQEHEAWNNVWVTTTDNAIGTVHFPAPATAVDNFKGFVQNLNFSQGNSYWNQ